MNFDLNETEVERMARHLCIYSNHHPGTAVKIAEDFMSVREARRLETKAAIQEAHNEQYPDN